MCLDLKPWTEIPPNDRRRFHTSTLSWQVDIDDLRESSVSGCPFCALALKASQYPVAMTCYNTDPQACQCRARACTKVEINLHNGLSLRKSQCLISEIVRIFPPTSVDWSPIGVGTRIGYISDVPGSKQGLDFIRSTFQQCTVSHEKCQKQTTTLPSRLLFIGSNSKPIKIVLPNPSNQIRYAALSHCWGKPRKLKWGKSRTLKLKRNNMAKLMNEIGWNSLPQTYQDAITACRALNIDYLWIDSLFIVQDDKEDWAYEASRMADVYGDAVIVIGASSTRHPNESFLSKRDNWRCEPHIIAWDDSTKASPLLYARVGSHLGRHRAPLYGQQYDPLERRAWAFQEFRLAKRCLNFSSDEIQWFCKEGQICECSPTWEPWDPLELSLRHTSLAREHETQFALSSNLPI